MRLVWHFVLCSRAFASGLWHIALSMVPAFHHRRYVRTQVKPSVIYVVSQKPTRLACRQVVTRPGPPRLPPEAGVRGCNELRLVFDRAAFALIGELGRQLGDYTNLVGGGRGAAPFHTQRPGA